jgi:hypothetical protein
MQIKNKENTAILTSEEFRVTYNHMTKTIKEALQHASIIFSPTPLPTQQLNHTRISQQTPTNITPTPNPSSQHTLGRAIHAITKEKTSIRKDKWGAQAITKQYLCQWQNPQGPTLQWRKEADLLHLDNILLDHNLLRITQFHNTTTTQLAIQKYATHTTHTQTKDKRYVRPPSTSPTYKPIYKNVTRTKTSSVTNPPYKYTTLNPTYMTKMVNT